MMLPITPASTTGLSLTPVAAATRAVAPVSAVAAARPVTVDDRPTRPVTPLSMSLHLMRVPTSRLADVYNEMRSLASDSGPATRFSTPADASAPPSAAGRLHLRA